MKIRHIVSGVGVCAVTGAVVASAWFVPAPVPQSHPVDAVMPEAATLALICNGGVQRTVEAGVSVDGGAEVFTGGAGVLDRTSTAAEWLSFSKNATPRVDNPDFSTMKFAASGLGGISYADGVVYVDGGDGESGPIAGSSVLRADRGDFRGLINNPCSWSDNSAWLVGSNTEVGTYNVLQLANPMQTPVTVTIDAYSATGQLDLGANATVNIPAQSREEIRLDGLVDAAERTAFHVSSAAGQFAAALQTNSLDGFTPTGIDMITAADYGSSLVIPGVVVPASTSASAEQQSTSLADPNTSATLRLVNPTDGNVTVDVATVIGEQTTELPGGSDVTIAPNSVLDLSLTGLAPGTYAVEVEASADISAAVKLAESAGAAGTDVAWIPAQSPMLSAGARVGESGTLVINASEPTSATVQMYTSRGEKTEKSLAVDGVARVPIPAEVEYVWVDAQSPVAANVYMRTKLAQGYGIAVAPLSAGADQSVATKVLVRP